VRSRELAAPPSHGGSQGFKSPHLHPQHCRSERRRLRAGGAHCLLRPQHGRKLKSQSSREDCQRRGDSALGLTNDHAAWSPPAANRRAILAHPGDPGQPSDRPGPPPNHFPRRRPSRSPPMAQHGLRQPRGPGSNLGQMTRVVDTAGDHATLAIQPCGCLPHATLHDLIPIGHSGRRKARTPDAHIGRRRPDTGHLDARTPAPDTGHRSLGQAPVDTGHRRGQGNDSTAGVRTSWASSPSDHMLGRPTVFLLSCYQATAGSLCGPGRASAHCSPRTNFGSRVEREAGLQVLWRPHIR
jgi:hypothetical protein